MAEGERGVDRTHEEADQMKEEETPWQHTYLVSYTWKLKNGNEYKCLSPHTRFLTTRDELLWWTLLQDEKVSMKLDGMFKQWDLKVSQGNDAITHVDVLHLIGPIEEAVEHHINGIVDKVQEHVFQFGRGVKVEKIGHPECQKVIAGLQKCDAVLRAEIMTERDQQCGYVVYREEEHEKVEELYRSLLCASEIVKECLEFKAIWETIFIRTGLLSELQKHHPDVHGKMQNTEEGLLLYLEGQRDCVAEAAKLIRHFKDTVQSSSKSFDIQILNFKVFEHKSVCAAIDELLQQRGISCAWFPRNKKIKIVALSSDTIEQGITAMREYLTEKIIPMDPTFETLIRSTKWSRIVKDLEKEEPSALILVTQDGVYVTGIATDVDIISERIDQVRAKIEEEETTRKAKDQHRQEGATDSHGMQEQESKPEPKGEEDEREKELQSNRKEHIVKVRSSDYFEYILTYEMAYLITAASDLGVGLSHKADCHRFFITGQLEKVTRIEEILNEIICQVTSDEYKCPQNIDLTDQQRGKYFEKVEAQCSVLVEKQSQKMKKERKKRKDAAAQRVDPDTDTLRWRLGPKQVVQVVSGPVSSTEADVIVDIAEKGQNRENQGGKLENTDILYYNSWRNNADYPISKLQTRVSDLIGTHQQKGATSFAFPVKGPDRWPADKYIDALINGLKVMFTQGASSQPQEEDTEELLVYLCAEGAGERRLFVDRCTFLRLEPWDEDGHESEPPRNHIKVTVEKGMLHKTEADVLVNTASQSLDLRHGAVSYSLQNAAGRDLQKQCDREMQRLNKTQGLQHGEMVVTSGCNLKCKFVFHGVLTQHIQGDKEEFYEQSIQRFVETCIRAAEEKQCRSIAFPAIGTGNLQYPVHIVARSMVKAAMTYTPREGSSLKEIKVVIFEKDVESFKTFQLAQRKIEETLQPRRMWTLKIVGRKENITQATHLLDDWCQKQNDTGPESNPHKDVSTSRRDMNTDPTNQQKEKGKKEEQQIQQKQQSAKQVNPSFSWSQNTKNVKTFTTKENLMIKIYEGNIVNVPVDCIVNAANPEMKHGGGIALAISLAAGRKLDDESDAIVQKSGKLQAGQICVTTAGHLPYKAVIHAVGPQWRHFLPHTKKSVEDCEEDLRFAVYYSLVAAEKKKMASIAIPAISAGIYGVPLEICTVQYASAVLWFEKDRDRKFLKEIHFIDLSSSIVANLQDTFKAMIPNGNPPNSYRKEVYYQKSTQSTYSQSVGRSSSGGTRHNKEQYPNMDNLQNGVKCRMSENHELLVYTGDIALSKGFGCVAVLDNLKGTGTSALASKLKKEMGSTYANDKHKMFLQTPRWGDIVVTKGDHKHFKKVLHAFVKPKTKLETEEERKNKFRHIFKRIFMEASGLFDKYGCQLMMPLLGTGTGNADPAFCASLFFQSYSEFCIEFPKRTLSVHLVSIEHDKTQVIRGVISEEIKVYLPYTTPKENGLNAVEGKKDEKPARPPLPGCYQGQPIGSENLTTGKSDDLIDAGKRGSTQDDRQTDQQFLSRKSSRKKHSMAKSLMSSETAREPTEKASNTENQTQVDMKCTGIDKSKTAAADEENCVICMDQVTDAKKLKCGHIYCRECIDNYFKTGKQKCPTCGEILGVVLGDQPDEGHMSISKSKISLAGFDGCGSISITYTFPDGIQQANHPNPGQRYKGISRTAYLPDNTEGNLVCKMLKVAFDRKLVFTIGHSRTTGQEGVITWNDIHHKTNPNPDEQFGYPDLTYFVRVTDELVAKGVTPNDTKDPTSKRQPMTKSRRSTIV